MLLFVANKFNYTLRSMERKKKKNKKYNYINLNLRKKKEKLLDIFFRPLELLPFYACSMPLMVPVCVHALEKVCLLCPRNGSFDNHMTVGRILFI
jgi:hypothetical protein